MRKEFLDIPIDWIEPDELTHKLKVFVANPKPHHITTVNTEFVVVSRTNADFRRCLQESDLSVADGTGIVLAQTYFDHKPSPFWLVRLLQYLGIGFRCVLAPHTLPYKRIIGVDLSETLMELAAQEGWRVFLLGAKPGIADKAGRIWQSRYDKLKIAGTSTSGPNDPDVIDQIRTAKPDVLLVAYGTPKQELFIWQHKHDLKVPIMVGIGGTFDTVVGTRIYVPRFIKNLGLEWLVYLIRYPSRFKRIWRSTLTYSALILKQK
jgi:N-acetylglucosaminyldiphosphoundecaprenol N-acetyl-beta-D-mannosaminyltransferase